MPDTAVQAPQENASRPLHLLRQFTGWMDNTITTLEEAEEWLKEIREGGGSFYTPTRRHPRRADELIRGSIYYCHKRHTVFRMPVININIYSEWCLIYAEPRMIRVEPRYVGFVRGWRYLEDADKPMDRELPGEIPGDIGEILREIGVG